jgi:uncharacterized protein (TIGR00106 family)
MPYRLHNMGTTVEGEAEKLFALAKQLHQLPFKAGIRRVYTVIALDDRRDKKVALEDKIKSLRKQLRRK